MCMYVCIRLSCEEEWIRKSATEKRPYEVLSDWAIRFSTDTSSHNYFRERDGFGGKTPAEVANIRIEGKNKIFTVIQNAAKAI